MAKLIDVGSIGSYFESLSDPRHTRNRKHLMVDIAVIAVCGIICGCDGPTAIHRWAKHRASWLAQHLGLPNGIPSRDCIRRLLMALKPEAFQRCFRAWISDAIPTDEDNPARLVAIDGKSCRRSHDKAKDLGALHIVSAWASAEGIALGQVATDAKSNEITAIPLLLEQIDLDGTLITIDAMGCQKDIVEQIVMVGDLAQRDSLLARPGADDVQCAEVLRRVIRPATALAVDRHEASRRVGVGRNRIIEPGLEAALERLGLEDHKQPTDA